MRKNKLDKIKKAISEFDEFLEELDSEYNILEFHKDNSVNEFLGSLLGMNNKEEELFEHHIKLSKRTGNLKLENLIFVHAAFCIFYQLRIEWNKIIKKENKILRTKRDCIVFYNAYYKLLKSIISDNTVNQILYPHSNTVSKLLECDMEELIRNDKFRKIDSYVNHLNNNLDHENYKFISSINTIAFSNIIKFYLLIVDSGVNKWISSELGFIKNLPLLMEMNNSRELVDFVESKVKDLTPERELYAFGFEDEEDQLIKLKKEQLKLFASIPSESILMSLKENIVFNKKNVRGFARILYEIFEIITEDSDLFPSREEWFYREDENLYRRSLNNRDWRTYQTNTVAKIVDPELFFIEK